MGGDADEDALRAPKPLPGLNCFLLALTWPNQYCLSKPCNPSIPNQYFTIHGLWPQCTPANSLLYCTTTIAFNPNDLVPMEEKLLQYRPDLKNAEDFTASMDFWKREWKKHGTCSSNKFTAKEYFEKSIALAEKYSAKIYEALINKGVIPNGNKYRDLDILSPVAEGIGVVPSLGYANQRQALAEIRLCVKDDAVTLFDCGTLTFSAPPASSPSLSQSRSTRWGVSSVLEAVHNAV